MIVMFTDFGLEGPYVGQMQAVLHREAPGVPVVNLFSDLPRFDATSAAYLLAAYRAGFPAGSVFLCVVDPGVGGERDALVVEADDHRFVGPDNGLFDLVVRRARQARAWRIEWRPASLSASFHGRDLFAPVAAGLGRGDAPRGVERPYEYRHRPLHDDLYRIVYVDRYGNAMSGVRADRIERDAVLEVAGHRLRYAETFSAVAEGEAFWYENANGLAEIAVNQGRADRDLDLTVGTPVTVVYP